MTRQINLRTGFMTFATKKNLLITVYVIVSVLIYYLGYLLQFLDTTKWMFYMSIFIVAHISISLGTVILVGVNFLSLTGLFLVLTYIFHFGQIILMGLFQNYKFQHFNILSYVSYDVVQLTTLFQILTVSALVIGILMSVKPNLNEKSLSEIKSGSNNGSNIGSNIISNTSIILTGWTIVILCFPVRFNLDLSKIQASMAGDYFDVFSTGESGISSMFGYFLFVGIALLIMEYSKQKKRLATVIFLIIICYLFFTMLSGNRGQQLTILLMLGYIYFKCVYKMKIRTIILLVIVGWLLVTFLNAIFAVRLSGIDSIQDFELAYQASLENDPILKLIEELGQTQYTVSLTMEQVKSAAWGQTYLAGLPLVFVNINGILDGFVNTTQYTKSLNANYIGGSFIGELFFNFKYFGVFFAVFIGFAINKVSQKIENLIYQRKYLMVTFYIPLFTYSLWWVRDYFSGWIRPTVWGGIFIFCVYLFVREFIIKKRKRQAYR